MELNYFKYGPPLEITPAGILLRSYAAELLEKKKRMENDMLTLRAAKSGTLRIGCTFARAQFQLPQIIKDFNNKYPFIQVKIFEGNTPDVEEMLMKRNVDLSIGFVPETGQNIISLPLYDDPFLIVIHPPLSANISLIEKQRCLASTTIRHLKKSLKIVRFFRFLYVRPLAKSAARI